LLTTTLLAALLATWLTGLLVLLTGFLLAALLTAALILTALLARALVLIAHRNFSRGMIPHRENRSAKSLFRFRNRGDWALMETND
jgi:hypothetical protein